VGKSGGGQSCQRWVQVARSDHRNQDNSAGPFFGHMSTLEASRELNVNFV
jgi:hypothetical protein